MTGTKGYRPHVEAFEGITWDPANRDVHFQKHGIDFPIAAKFNWTRILKRKDAEHPDRPPRFNALAEVPGIDLVFLVVYTKSDGWLNIISIRLANAEERAIFRAG
ncbi:BrnT family toxin [Azospirillum sp.]|uniref:BrnT family toxin n=1 Tax=Azospirillum sp. TaxID=34012 RepID=UPI002D2B23A7|nr:BrnT family toxin [Azospirillum sp.]HYD66585.1 BrnT family toxin [Azospirillum sp.]